MKKIKVYHYDVFSNEPNKGNPAGVVLDGDHLTEEEMQEIAQQVGFNMFTEKSPTSKRSVGGRGSFSKVSCFIPKEEQNFLCMYN